MPHDDSGHESLRILVIVSRPLDLRDLPNLADQWALQKGLQRVQAPVYLKMLRPPTVEAFRTEILGNYDIVHFDGHGDFGLRCKNCGALNLPKKKTCERCEALLEGLTASGFLAFEREDGMQDALAAEEMAEIVMSAPEHPARLVFLSACESAKGGESGLQSALLKKGVPTVLAMNESITSGATIALATPFYAALGAGKSIAQALKDALPALRSLENGGKLQKIPVLDGPGKDARLVTVTAAGKARFEAERLFGLSEHEFVGDFLRGNPPRGRKGLLSQAMNAFLDGEKLVVLTGQGGIGKTVLAEEAARRLAWRYPGGVFFRSAAEMERLGLEELLNAFDNVFGAEFRTLSLDKKRDNVLSYLRDYDSASLLVVDNAESIIDPGLWRFLEGIPQPSAALVTTRESLPCGGREIRVPEMEPEEAGRLLLGEARRRAPGFGEHLSQEDQESLNEIARVMQGHPLAIKLVAALVSRRSLASIRDELRRNPPRGVSERFDVSYRSLTEAQSDLFSRLAVFSGSMTEEAVGKICIEEGSSGWQNDLGELEQRSFLDRIGVPALDEISKEVTLYRYRLHPLMRQYAAGKAGDELLARLRPKAAKHFLDYARQFSSNFDMMELERENTLTGMDWAIGQQKSSSDEARRAASTLVLEFMAVLDSFLDTRGYWNERHCRLLQSIEAAKSLGDPRQKAICINSLGNIFHMRGEYYEARKLYQHALKIFHKLGDKRGISVLLNSLGVLAQDIGNNRLAWHFLVKSLKIKQELGNAKGISDSLYYLSIIARNIGEYEKSRELCQQSFKIDCKFGDKSGMSKTLHQLSILAHIANDYAEAMKFSQQSLEIKQELRDTIGISNSLHQMGILARDAGNLEKAYKYFLKSMIIKQKLGDKKGVASCQAEIAMLETQIGNNKDALQLIRLAEVTFLELGSPYAKLAGEVRQRLEKMQ